VFLKVQFVFLYVSVFRSLLFCVVSRFVGFGFFQHRAKRLAGKNVSEMTHFVSSGTLNLAPSVLAESVFHLAKLVLVLSISLSCCMSM